jgi:biopolymer transport protein ExbD
VRIASSLLVLTAAAVAQADVSAPPAAASASATLSCASEPPNAMLLVAGRAVGRAPQTVKLAPGSYRVVAVSGAAYATATISLRAGQARRLTLKLPPASEAHRLVLVIRADGALSFDDGYAVNEDELEAHLRAAIGDDRELALTIAADKRTTYERVVLAMDRARQAGVTRIAFAVAPPGGH